jgi:hypothetical protein
MINWADARFAHRFAGGPPPERPPRSGPEHAARQRREWLRHVVAWATGTALLGLVVSFSYTLWPRSAEES